MISGCLGILDLRQLHAPVAPRKSTLDVAAAALFMLDTAMRTGSVNSSRASRACDIRTRVVPRTQGLEVILGEQTGVPPRQ